MKLIILFALFLSIGCISSQPYVDIGGKKIYVEIADSPQEWETGLMFRQSLDADKGMLFIFPDEAQRSFWMKNTLIPLDMIFADSQGIVTNITKNAQPCRAILCESYYGYAKYVLEVNGNTANVKVRDKVIIIKIT